jgi:hypothetical protein
MVIRGSISFVLVYLFRSSSFLFRAWNRKYFGLFGKTFGAYLYRFY